MRIIPVIDLMHGEVVRGVGGRREEYRPIQSILAADARPRSIARALAEAGFRQAYVADLDAIAGRDPAWPVYEILMSAGLSLTVDAGLSTAGASQDIAQFSKDGQPLSGIVAGLETIDNPEELRQLIELVGSSRLIFSLDMKAGQPLARSGRWRSLSSEQIADTAIRCGARRMIVLDLAAVGMDAGVGTEPLCRTLRCRHGKLELIAGGGVRGWDDLRSLAAAGCDATLVASALHDGRLSATECAALR
jgi:phosphoribosylformimino-5-aminoimidazole carboxamide ribotide isomerase